MNCTKNIGRGCCFSRNEQGEAVAEDLVGCHKMEATDWLEDIPNPLTNNNIYEIQFKNTRKSFYENGTELEFKKGDIVVVESMPGVDVGIVSLKGDLVARQMKRTGFSTQDCEFRKIIRIAKPHDIEKWQEAIALEHNTMIRSRQISSDLGLKMKIGDVEYQGDRLKAIFYYIADERVDFRELIKILAEQFRIRVEMKQIGARQEAGRIGGISACGRELCCSTWQNSFQSVTIGAARHQEISLNPQKLAGQCGKLKCCLNYEVDTYIDARKDFPRLNAPLEAMDGSYHLVKSDIFKKIMWFSPDPYKTAIMIPLGIDRVRKILALNRKGAKIDRIEDESLIKEMVEEPTYMNVVGEESITRFDKGAGTKNRNNRNRNSRNNNPQTDQPQSENVKKEVSNHEKPQKQRPPRPPRAERPEGARAADQQQQPRPPRERPKTAEGVTSVENSENLEQRKPNPNRNNRNRNRNRTPKPQQE